MSELKTRPNRRSVEKFLAGVEDPERRADCLALVELMREVTGEEPRMWGPSIVGFGSYHYRYASGREGDWFLAGFSPRARDLTLYIMSGFSRHEELMARLGKHKKGKSCLYLKRLADVDRKVLARLVRESAKHVKKTSVA
ncbi:MAG: DUF1801 domain-containing protein [Acidobacteriota bacterium]|nr:DUF1801 domain-containing protein [Acidobacteriota bacterium]MDH3525481.1 DUF1801 domain-containing protein [Acidobacteriota bacterium]